MITYNLNRLFPVCVLNTSIGRDFTEEEKEAFSNIEEFRKNTGNVTSVNNFVLEDKRLSAIKKSCLDGATVFLKEVIKPDNNPKLYITQSWLNITSQDEFHHEHSHANSIVSGVLYLDVKDNKDRICFVSPKPAETISFSKTEHTIDNAEIWFFPVKKGDLILFPSSLRHYVEPNKEEHKRISLSFNTFVKGLLGKKESLTFLDLEK